MTSANEQGKLWGTAAHNWATLQEPQNKPLFKKMLDEARVSEGTVCLDAGCGGGSASLMASNRGATVYGLDASEELIAFAKNHVPSANFRIGDIQDLPYDDNFFDAVIASNVIQFAEDHIAAMRELGRVCKDDGIIVFSLFSTPQKLDITKLLQAIIQVLPQRPTGGGPFALSAPGVLENLIESAGLHVKLSDEVNTPFTYPDVDTFWLAFSSSGPLQNAMRVAGEDKVKHAVYETIKQFTADDSTVTIQQNMLKYVVATPG